MKENEIQIGDWLRRDYGGAVKDFRVDELIRNYDLKMCVYCELGYMGDVDQIEPIPLTAEILEKNGFVCKDIPFSPEWELFGLTLRRWDDRFHLKCEKDIDMEIIYVHQLQHLLKMVGIHRDIVL